MKLNIAKSLKYAYRFNHFSLLSPPENAIRPIIAPSSPLPLPRSLPPSLTPTPTPTPTPPPPPPPPFILPQRNNTKQQRLPRMLRLPPPKPWLSVPYSPIRYIEKNTQLLERPENLLMELTITACQCPLDTGLYLPSKLYEGIVGTPIFRVHGLRLCFLNEYNKLVYLNHQNQRFLDQKTREEESEFARTLILKDLNNYGITVEELLYMWYNDHKRQDQMDFWIYQFLKHGYMALNDPMLDYCSTIHMYAQPILSPVDDYPALGRFLYDRKFRTNQYHSYEEFHNTLIYYFGSKPLVTFLKQKDLEGDEHTCLREISVIRTYPVGYEVDHPFSRTYPGEFLMRMI